MLAGAGAAVSINVEWFVAAGFLGALGASLWRYIPRAIKGALHDVVVDELKPESDKTHAKIAEIQASLLTANERFDAHLTLEEGSFSEIAVTTAAMKAQLEDRTLLFDGLQATMEDTQQVLKSHIDADERQFEASTEALKAGQRELLAEIKATVKPKKPKRQSATS